MKYVKITYKNDYDTNRVKGNRPLLRAFQKGNVKSFIENDNPIIFAYYRDKYLYELLTNKPLIIKNFEFEDVDYEDVMSIIKSCSKEELSMVYKIISVMYFNEIIDLGFDITDMEEAWQDRVIQLKAYENGLTDINPYDSVNDYSINNVKKYGYKK